MEKPIDLRTTVIDNQDIQIEQLTKELNATKKTLKEVVLTIKLTKSCQKSAVWTSMLNRIKNVLKD